MQVAVQLLALGALTANTLSCSVNPAENHEGTPASGGESTYAPVVKAAGNPTLQSRGPNAFLLADDGAVVCRPQENGFPPAVRTLGGSSRHEVGSSLNEQTAAPLEELDPAKVKELLNDIAKSVTNVKATLKEEASKAASKNTKSSFWSLFSCTKSTSANNDCVPDVVPSQEDQWAQLCRDGTLRKLLRKELKRTWPVQAKDICESLQSLRSLEVCGSRVNAKFICKRIQKILRTVLRCNRSYLLPSPKGSEGASFYAHTLAVLDLLNVARNTLGLTCDKSLTRSGFERVWTDYQGTVEATKHAEYVIKEAMHRVCLAHKGKVYPVSVSAKNVLAEFLDTLNTACENVLQTADKFTGAISLDAWQSISRAMGATAEESWRQPFEVMLRTSTEHQRSEVLLVNPDSQSARNLEDYIKLAAVEKSNLSPADRIFRDRRAINAFCRGLEDVWGPSAKYMWSRWVCGWWCGEFSKGLYDTKHAEIAVAMQYVKLLTVTLARLQLPCHVLQHSEDNFNSAEKLLMAAVKGLHSAARVICSPHTKAEVNFGSQVGADEAKTLWDELQQKYTVECLSRAWEDYRKDSRQEQPKTLDKHLEAAMADAFWQADDQFAQEPKVLPDVRKCPSVELLLPGITKFCQRLIFVSAWRITGEAERPKNTAYPPHAEPEQGGQMSALEGLCYAFELITGFPLVSLPCQQESTLEHTQTLRKIAPEQDGQLSRRSSHSGLSASSRRSSLPGSR